MSLDYDDDAEAETRELDDRCSQLVADLDQAYSAIDQWTERLNVLKADLRDIVNTEPGRAVRVAYRGELIARVDWSTNRGKFNRAGLAKKYPAAHEEFWTPGVGQTSRLTWRPGSGRKPDFR